MSSLFFLFLWLSTVLTLYPGWDSVSSLNYWLILKSSFFIWTSSFFIFCSFVLHFSVKFFEKLWLLASNLIAFLFMIGSSLRTLSTPMVRMYLIIFSSRAKSYYWRRKSSSLQVIIFNLIIIILYNLNFDNPEIMSLIYTK